ncbi:MAG TPA: hypothetical protein VFB66_30170 [Tepidisphaeraceae bacterium]|nr:hypothetical protein [Tepidisphaeraceae bacterium]
MATDWWDQFPTVRAGTWRYDGTVPCRVRVIKCTYFLGSGDVEDPPEVRDDRDAECYYVRYSPPIGPFRDTTAGPYFSLDEALRDAERVLGDAVQWDP